ncbi:hypothetical protein A8F94_11705 [Bacillus sp. FJAT-27225]|uniref:2-dehydropantoate 2-reductase n=1 Tax=Bacillus sp. FJAT-27225 TaxID=1743144 RepID=UPI00080C2279|nr:2-dehydropantoate 2-reductase [Bacillus sp. FJAT-27225]OCA85546.1 hypothetical protein A8F94_11705 [Bacillus sp. FJAT-27225]
MKIGVIGAGSIGLLFAAYLQTRFKVLLFTRTAEQADEINKSGITLKRADKVYNTTIEARALAEKLPDMDLAIVAVKQYQLENILPILDSVSNVLFLQNGMGHLKLISRLSSNNLFVGTVEHGAFREGAAAVTHNGTGVTKAAVFRGDGKMLSALAEREIGSFPFTVESDYYSMLANKLAANAVINPLTAILRVENGQLIANPFYERNLEALYHEVASILEFDDKEAQLENIKRICKNTAENRSSMLKDIEAGSVTEIDAILGYLLEQAEAKGKNVPLITAFYHLVKGIESGMGGNR